MLSPVENSPNMDEGPTGGAAPVERLAGPALDADRPPAPDVPRWYYVIHGRRMGPISTVEMTQLLLRGPYDPLMLVWRQGMLAWSPASQMAELLLPGLSALASPPPVPVDILRAERLRRNARTNSVAFAIVFGLVCVGILSGLFSGAPMSGLLALAFLPGLFVTIYFPLRYRVIQSLSPGYRLAGLVGGIGLLIAFWGLLLVLVLRNIL